MIYFSDKMKRLQRMKKDYGDLYMYFVQEIAENDPMGLIRMGAPGDEYEFETSAILSRLDEADSADALAKIMCEEFAKAFDKGSDLQTEKVYQRYLPRLAPLGEKGWREWMCWKEEHSKEKP